MPKEIEKFLTTYSKEVAALAIAARRLVLAVAPQAKEQLHSGWRAISYRQQTVVCSLCPHTNWVNVQFQVGTSLEDPERLLKGTGKTMRHVKLKSLADLNEPLKALLIQAEALSH